MQGFHFTFVTKEKVIEYKSVTTITHMSIMVCYFHLYNSILHLAQIEVVQSAYIHVNTTRHNLFLIPFVVTIRLSATIFKIYLNLSKNIQKAYEALHMSRPNGYHKEISSTISIHHAIRNELFSLQFWLTKTYTSLMSTGLLSSTKQFEYDKMNPFSMLDINECHLIFYRCMKHDSTFLFYVV